MEPRENSVIIVKAARWNGDHWMEMSIIGDTLEIYTSFDGETDADGFDMPYVESISEWGNALHTRIGQIVTKFLHDAKYENKKST